MRNSTRTATALLAVGLTAVLTACGSTVGGTAQPAETDIRTLDTGSYPTEPINAHDADPVPPFYEMDEVAGMRIADYVIHSGEIDPRMTFGKRGGTVMPGVLPSELGDSTVLSDIAKKHKMLYGFESNGTSKDSTINSSSGWPSKQAANQFTATTMVFQFPDAERANAAAREFYDVDLAAQEGKNQPVALPGYPAALSHWRPDSPFLRTLLPHGPYVIAFLLSVDSPDQQALVTMAETAYGKQIAALDRTAPLTDEEVMTLPWDPQHVLMRTLNPEELSSPDGSGQYLLTGRHGILHYSGDPLPADRQFVEDQFTKMNAEQIALSWGSVGVRTADPASARRAVTEKLLPWRVETDAAAPPNVPDSACVENKQVLDGRKRFSCIVAYHQYVGIVSSNQLLDAQQRAAAQYAVFANTR
ncbi:hypothetical protein ACFXK0_21235 [Nocardia sp. NPDC059177]|uniref:DUF7373 family lipoprotein n=1 Tax=Nocardia sp. NPDC059177 TaxID=3346759 RepID=UPI0036B372BA